MGEGPPAVVHPARGGLGRMCLHHKCLVPRVKQASPSPVRPTPQTVSGLFALHPPLCHLSVQASLPMCTPLLTDSFSHEMGILKL